MNSCPNCGKKIEGEIAVCDCGELLRAEVTHHGQSWETETVFNSTSAVNPHRVATVSVALVIAATLLVIAWPQIRERLASTDDTTSNLSQTSDVSQGPAHSDIIPPDETELRTPAEPGSTEGVFDFSSGGTSVTLAENDTRSAGVARPNIQNTNGPVGQSGNTLEAQLLTDKGEGPPEKKTEKSKDTDCNPEITLNLVKVEPRSATPPAETQASRSTPSYFLGPRGGCYYVTAGGSKKYVDRSLCAQTTAAAGRQ